jgi:hypothetical protein
LPVPSRQGSGSGPEGSSPDPQSPPG